MNDEGVSQPFLTDSDGSEHALEPFEAQVRHGKRHLHLQDVAEGPETCVQENVADLGDDLARRGVDFERHRWFAREEFLQNRCTFAVEDHERIADNRARENLVDAGDVLVHDGTEMVAELGDGTHRNLWHLELDPVSGQLRKRGSRPAKRDVQQFDERVLLVDRELLHTALPVSAASSALRMSCLSNGLLTNAAPPALRTSSCEDVWMSADTTMTLMSGSISRSFASTSSPYMPFITKSSMTTSGFSRKKRSSAFSPSLASSTSYPADSRMDRIVLRAIEESSTINTFDFTIASSVPHTRSTIASASRSSGILASLSPASTTDLGIP